MARKGETLSPETRAKIGEKVSAALRGKPKSKETRAKIGLGNRGKIRTSEQRAKLAESMRTLSSTRRSGYLKVVRRMRTR